MATMPNTDRPAQRRPTGEERLASAVVVLVFILTAVLVTVFCYFTVTHERHAATSGPVTTQR